jgi:mono/diheme cytochrome c family protein
MHYMRDRTEDAAAAIAAAPSGLYAEKHDHACLLIRRASGVCENEPVKPQILPALFLAIAATGWAQAPDTQAAAQAGAALFQNNCARCHGANLEGSKKAPRLAEIDKKKHWTDERITNRILNGEGKKMPPFREALSADQIQQLVAFLRSENRPAPPPSPQSQ